MAEERTRVRHATDRTARRNGPRPLPPLNAAQERALIASVNAARHTGPSTVHVESDARGGLRLTRPDVEYVAGDLEPAA